MRPGRAWARPRAPARVSVRLRGRVSGLGTGWTPPRAARRALPSFSLPPTPCPLADRAPYEARAPGRPAHWRSGAFLRGNSAQRLLAGGCHPRCPLRSGGARAPGTPQPPTARRTPDWEGRRSRVRTGHGGGRTRRRNPRAARGARPSLGHWAEPARWPDGWRRWLTWRPPVESPVWGRRSGGDARVGRRPRRDVGKTHAPARAAPRNSSGPLRGTQGASRVDSA